MSASQHENKQSTRSEGFQNIYFELHNLIAIDRTTYKMFSATTLNGKKLAVR